MTINLVSLDRRRFLRGTGVALALPWFESFVTSASAAEQPARRKRLACFYMPDGVPMPLAKDPAHKDWAWFPHGNGKKFTFTKCLEPLEPLRNALTVLSGLSHPSVRSIHGHSNADQFLTGAPTGPRGDYRNSVVAAREQSPDITVPRPLPGPHAAETGSEPAVRRDRKPAETTNTVSAGDSPNDRTNSGHTAWAWLVPVWAAGAFLLFLRLLLGQFSLWRLSRQANLIEAGPLADTLKRLRLESGMQRNVVLLDSPKRSVPMTWGIWRPKLLLPDEACNWPADRYRAVLLHELAHIRRWDCLTHWIAQIACAVYWFHPLVWIAARQLQIEREKTCDDLVLNSGVTASQYAEHLLNIVAHCDGNLPAVSSCAVCMAQSTKLEGRLRAILAEGRSR